MFSISEKCSANYGQSDGISDNIKTIIKNKRHRKNNFTSRAENYIL